MLWVSVDNPAAAHSWEWNIRCDPPALAGQHRAVNPGRQRKWRCGRPCRGFRAGLTEHEIVRITEAEVGGGWSEHDRILLLVTDRLVTERQLGDTLWTALSTGWSLHQIMDIVFTVGQYVLVSTALNTFQVPLDEGLEGLEEFSA